MKTVFALLAASATTAQLAAADSIPTCPGSSAALHHASCNLSIQVQRGCETVQEEILARVAGENGWKDIHNGGQYKVLQNLPDAMALQRRTGGSTVLGQHFTDKINVHLASGGDSSSCTVSSCSESQTTSFKDFSTNYCNSHVLLCGAAEGCPVARTDLGELKETVQGGCSERDSGKCHGTKSEYEMENLFALGEFLAQEKERKDSQDVDGPLLA